MKKVTLLLTALVLLFLLPASAQMRLKKLDQPVTEKQAKKLIQKYVRGYIEEGSGQKIGPGDGFYLLDEAVLLKDKKALLSILKYQIQEISERPIAGVNTTKAESIKSALLEEALKAEQIYVANR